MLYWAEGTKQRNSVKITNSDAEVLAFFADFLEHELAVPRTRMRLSCNLFADHLERQREIEDHWLQKLRLPRMCLRKSTERPPSTSTARASFRRSTGRSRSTAASIGPSGSTDLGRLPGCVRRRVLASLQLRLGGD